MIQLTRRRWTNYQPMQLSSLRSIPNLKVFRPADINETLECWSSVFSTIWDHALILSRQKLNYVSNLPENRCQTYELNITSYENKVTLLASGSEGFGSSVQSELKERNSLKTNFCSLPRTF